MKELEKADLAVWIVSELLKADLKILAIKLVRYMYSANLGDAKRFVDKLQALMTIPLIVEALQEHGLFAAPLGNGDWMVGRASYIYLLDVGNDHYKDEMLSIAPTLLEAIGKWSIKHLGEINYANNKS